MKLSLKRCPFCNPASVADPMDEEYEPGIMGTVYKCRTCGQTWLPLDMEMILDQKIIRRRNEQILELKAEVERLRVQLGVPKK